MGRVRLLGLPLFLIALLAFGVGALQPAQADAKAKLKPKVGWGPLKSKKAAKKVTRTKWEPRRQNRKANNTVPTRKQIKHFRANVHRPSMPYWRHIDGQFKGTTDDILEWAAYKWGLPEDLLKAAAVHETWWVNSFEGDSGDSFGILQVRRPYHCCLPYMRDSTAFNADYYGAIIRSYYDGKQDWLNHDCCRADNGRPYKAGDLWGSVGAWSSGRWHLESNKIYVSTVKMHMRERTWRTHEWFDDKWLEG